MKRLCVFLVFVCMAFTTFAEDQRIRERESILDVNDCKIMLIFAGVWKYYPLVEKERAVWIIINSQGEYESIDWPHTPQRRVTIWSEALPTGLIAQAHTHGDHLDPKPSTQDVSVARQLNIPVYTLTRKGIWRAMPDGSITQQVGRGWFTKSTQECAALTAKARD